MAMTDIECHGCKSHKTLGLRGRWTYITLADGREMRDVVSYAQHPEVIAVRCAVCNAHFHVWEVIDVA